MACPLPKPAVSTCTTSLSRQGPVSAHVGSVFNKSDGVEVTRRYDTRVTWRKSQTSAFLLMYHCSAILAPATRLSTNSTSSGSSTQDYSHFRLVQRSPGHSHFRPASYRSGIPTVPLKFDNSLNDSELRKVLYYT